MVNFKIRPRSIFKVPQVRVLPFKPGRNREWSSPERMRIQQRNVKTHLYRIRANKGSIFVSQPHKGVFRLV